LILTILLRNTKFAVNCIKYDAEYFERLFDQSSIVIDKTPFVAAFMLGINANGIVIVFLPRKSGKTIATDSVAYFVEDRQLLAALKGMQKIWVSGPT
jgi:hypothetical protein